MRLLIVACNRERTPMPVAPIGAGNIASVAREAGHEVSFLDLMWVRKPEQELRKCIARTKPDLVGISIRNLDNTSWLHTVRYIDDARDYVRAAHESLGPEGRVVVGGAAIGVAPGPITEYVQADFGIWGDGEGSFLELLRCLDAGQAVDDVPGLVLPATEGTPTRVNPAMRMEDMGAIPSHHLWEWTDFHQYTRNSGPLQIQSRRGCSFQCTYCTYPQLEGADYRLKPAERIVEELAAMHQAHPDAAIEFVDNTFNVPLRYTINLCKAIAQADLGLNLHTSGFNPAAVTDELMEWMAKAGFTQIMVTPETASPLMLERMRKGFTRKHLDNTVRCRRHLLDQQHPMQFLWVFLLGGPGETWETIDETFAFIDQEIPQEDFIFVQVGLRVYPHTHLQQEAIDEGMISADDPLLDSFHYVSPQLDEQGIYRLLVERIARDPRISTLKDVTHPLFPLYMRVAGAVGVKAPVTRASSMLSTLGRLRMRKIGFGR